MDVHGLMKVLICGFITLLYCCCFADGCTPDPCQNGGVCYTLGSDTKCSCVNGYTGEICQTPPADPCASFNPCMNGGRCYMDGSASKCVCRHGYTGSKCQIHPANICLFSNPCINDGLCYAVGSRTKCWCLRGYSGDRCETSPANVTVEKTDMRPVLRQLITNIVVYNAVKYDDNKECATKTRDKLNQVWPCCWDVIVVNSDVDIGWSIWYVPDHHIFLQVEPTQGAKFPFKGRKILVAKDNYDFLTYVYNPNQESGIPDNYIVNSYRGNPFGDH